jgi:hypothetical protein
MFPDTVGTALWCRIAPLRISIQWMRVRYGLKTIIKIRVAASAAPFFASVPGVPQNRSKSKRALIIYYFLFKRFLFLIYN